MAERGQQAEAIIFFVPGTRVSDAPFFSPGAGIAFDAGRHLKWRGRALLPASSMWYSGMSFALGLKAA